MMWKELQEKAMAFFLGVVLCGVIVCFAEFLARKVSHLHFQGFNSDLLRANVFNGSYANIPNANGQNFGNFIFTDKNGFRIPSAEYKYPESHKKTVLFLGDSITFGANISEEQTFIGRIRKQQPKWFIENSSVIGYSLSDYINVSKALLKKKSSYDAVFLMLCLNDIYEVSASGINFEINQNKERLAGGKKLPDNFTESLRKIAVIEKLNLFLRSNSKLYLILKGILTDPEFRYFYAEYLEYQTASVNNLEKIAELSRMFDEAGSSFYVFIAPYQHQIKVLRDEREPDKRYEDVTMPQKIISELLIEKGVKVHDLTQYFVENGNKRQSLFIPFDPMHFSDEGHRIVAEYFERNIFQSHFTN